MDFHSRLFYICAPAPTDCFQIAIIADGQNQQHCRIRNNGDEAAIDAAVDFTNFQHGFLTNCQKIFQNLTVSGQISKTDVRGNWVLYVFMLEVGMVIVGGGDPI